MLRCLRYGKMLVEKDALQWRQREQLQRDYFGRCYYKWFRIHEGSHIDYVVVENIEMLLRLLLC